MWLGVSLSIKLLGMEVTRTSCVVGSQAMDGEQMEGMVALGWSGSPVLPSCALFLGP